MAKNEKYERMYTEYCKGFTLEEVGKMFCMTRQSVYTGFKGRGLKPRSKKKLEYLFFNGNKYTLRNHGYYACTKGKRHLMHRDVWEYYNGPIPENHDIHHINFDRTDNRISNLELFRKDEHARLFATGHNQYTKKGKE